jgi:hypothetical protein
MCLCKCVYAKWVCVKWVCAKWVCAKWVYAKWVYGECVSRKCILLLLINRSDKNRFVKHKIWNIWMDLMQIGFVELELTYKIRVNDFSELDFHSSIVSFIYTKMS